MVGRFLQSVNLENEDTAVQTAFYLCSLGLADFDVTGTFYSKIAAAIVFIVCNKHRAVNAPMINEEHPEITFPKELGIHSEYNG